MSLRLGIGRPSAPKDSAAGVRRRCANIFKAEVKAAPAETIEEVSPLIAAVPSIVAKEISNLQEKNLQRDQELTWNAPVESAPEESEEVAPELTGPAIDPCLHRDDQQVEGVQESEGGVVITARPAEFAFKTGHRVVLAGLKNTALNGKVGSIVQLNAPKGALESA